MFKAEIIADSKNEFGNRITTFVVTFPRIILAEFNTHRMLSRNSASSRAIPFEKMLKSVEENPFVPIKWMEDHKGMQGDKYFSTIKSLSLDQDWRNARDSAIKHAVELNKLGVTKQMINRLLESFMWHTVIVTATEWENFFALRAHEAAEIHMQKISYMMLEEYNKSEPKLLKHGEWHIPFDNKINSHNCLDLGLKLKNMSDYKGGGPMAFEQNLINDIKIKISTSMCARISYTVVGEENKVSDYEKDIELHDKLLQMGHMSPFEHCAKADYYGTKLYSQAGNFIGFTQYRKLIEGENKKDERVIKK